MSFVRFIRRSSLHRLSDGSIHIQLDHGQVLRLGPGYSDLLEELRTGIDATQWRMRLKVDQEAARMECALTENGLLEQVALPGTALPLVDESDRPTTARTGLHCAGLLLGACLAVIAIVVLAIPRILVLPWWAWLFLPFMLAATSLIHEAGHFLVARLHGHRASIQMFKHGQVQARCVIKATGELPNSHTTVRILAAGPWTDCAIVAGCAAAAHFVAPHPLISLSLMCALLGFTFNLLPGKTSDLARMLEMVSVHRGLLVAAAWLVCVLLFAVALLMLSRLTGLSPL